MLIENNAFYNCLNLESVKFLSGDVSIEKYSFQGTKLRTISFKNLNTSIENYNLKIIF
mgnify:CR=1 FL=1